MKQSFVDIARYQDIAHEILTLTKQQGASAAEISASIGQGFTVDVRLEEVENIHYHGDQGFDVTVYFGQRKGSASTTDMTSQAFSETVEKACHIAQATQPDNAHGLAEPQFLAYQFPDLDLYHPWDITVDQAIELTKQCEHAGRNADARITNSEGASLSTHQGFYIYANTHNFMGHYLGTHHALSCTLLAEVNEDKQRDHEFTHAREANDLTAATTIGLTAAKKALARLHAKKITTRRSPILFSPSVARSLMGHLTSAIAGKNIYHQASFLLNQLGKPIFPDFINIEEKPHIPKALGSAPFDAEGIATQNKMIIHQGTLQSYLLGSYSARKLGLSPTGNAGGVHNFILHPTAGDFTALLKQMDTGLLITELMGQGINIVTGDYSRGAFGFWVEKGQIQYPVHEITIAGNLRDMFAHILATGNDLDWRSSIVTGSILIEEMMIAGT